MLLTILAFLLMVTVLVAAHEYGHYLVAKRFGMDVEEFCIGMGPKRWVYARKGGTEFTIRPFPIGGFVRVAGMMPEEDGSETKVVNGFYSKGPGPRIWMLLAGPVFSVLAGFALLLPLWAAVGQHKKLDNPIIGYASPKGAAHKAGLKEGDRITAVDGRPIDKFYQIVSYVRDVNGKPVSITFERAGKTQTISITPELDKEPTPVLSPALEWTEEKKIQSKLGIAFQTKRVPMGLADAAVAAFKRPFEMAADLFDRVMHPAKLVESVGGPESMVRGTGIMLSDSIYSYIEYAGMISMSLAIMNLLPIVPLDGGQIMIALAELARRGRRLSFRSQNIISSLGLTFVLLMFVSFITIDRIRWSKIDSEAKTATKAEK